MKRQFNAEYDPWEQIEESKLSDLMQVNQPKKKPKEKIREIGNFILRASTQVIKNQKPKRFQFKNAAQVFLESNHDDNINLVDIDL